MYTYSMDLQWNVTLFVIKRLINICTQHFIRSHLPMHHSLMHPCHDVDANIRLNKKDCVNY